MKVLKVLQKIFFILFIILFLLIVIPTVYIFFAKIVTKKLQPTFFGYASAVVISGSMNGTIEINDYVITKTQNEYQIGDIVMFVSQSGKSLVTHRIVAITEDGIQTKGDANEDPDNYITNFDKIIGKVVSIIPNVGLVFAFVTSPWGAICVFVIGMLIIESPYIIKKLAKGNDIIKDTKDKEKSEKKE